MISAFFQLSNAIFLLNTFVFIWKQHSRLPLSIVKHIKKQRLVELTPAFALTCRKFRWRSSHICLSQSYKKYSWILWRYISSIQITLFHSHDLNYSNKPSRNFMLFYSLLRINFFHRIDSRIPFLFAFA